MRKDFLLAVVATLAIIAAFHYTQSNKVDAFQEWKGQYGVTWTPSEESYRRLIFERNLLSIEKHNSDDTQTYKVGINQFTIYTQD